MQFLTDLKVPYVVALIASIIAVLSYVILVVGLFGVVTNPDSAFFSMILWFIVPIAAICGRLFRGSKNHQHRP